MTNKAGDGRHWRLESDADHIAWLTLDKAESAVNTLSVDVIAELDALLVEIEKDLPRGVIIRSAKKSGFIAGADVKEFLQLRDREQAAELIRGCHSVFDRLEALPCPTVCLIHGYCLGGGLELALACRYRIVEDEPGTTLGLPEVRLGIHPGFGGTMRLPRLVGHMRALDMMLSGRSVGARAAQRMGLVDYSVARRQFERAARQTVLQPPATGRRPPLPQRLAGYRLLRPLVAKVLRRNVAKRVSQQHYPAPYALIDLWLKYADLPRRMLAEEAASVSRLVVGDTAQNLIRVFFLRERLKALGRQAGARRIERVHVIGAGVMGGDIAIWCAQQGLRVTLQDQSPERIAPVIKRAYRQLKERPRQHRLVQAAMDRLMPDTAGVGVERADVVIEAIFENAEAKQALFRTLEPRMKPDALLATNTSSIPLEVLSQALARPERLVGLHFFNPVAKMQLVEVVAGPGTDPERVQQAIGFAGQIDRLPLPVTSSPGFLVNRVLMPYLLEAVSAAQEGIRPELIDRAAVAFGMPMGPIELADSVGLDICLSVAEILSESLRLPVPERLREMVSAGQLGRKSGRGFYAYKNGKPVKGKLDKSLFAPADLTDRLILSMLNEAVACLREGVVEDGDLLDAGIVFGTGFAPFRGGPIRYINESGVGNLVERLEQLARTRGERFTPDAGWGQL